MPRHGPKKRKNRRTEVYAERISQRKLRQVARRSQLRIGLKKIEAKAVVSQRGRTHWMEQEAPGITVAGGAQTVSMLSTAIKKFKYDLKSKVLRIWFVNGGSYNYFDVPESTVLALGQAQSKGNYFYYNIRTTFRFEQVS